MRSIYIYDISSLRVKDKQYFLHDNMQIRLYDLLLCQIYMPGCSVSLLLLLLLLPNFSLLSFSWETFTHPGMCNQQDQTRWSYLQFKKFLAIEHVPIITDFCICVYVFGCRLSLFRLCSSDFGITSIRDITNGITLAVFCFHIAHISFASSWHLFCLLAIVLVRLCILGTATHMSIKNGVHCFLIHECYMRSIKRYCFVRKYAAVPVQLEIVILQYTGWCVLIIQAFLFNQFSCFCQFLMDNFGQSTMPLQILGSCQLLTCRDNVLDCLRFFSTSSAQLTDV